MKYFIILALLCFAGISHADDVVTVSKEQLSNLSLINPVIQSKYPQFKGVYGSSDKLVVVGISGDTYKTEVDKLSVDTLVADKTNIAIDESAIQSEIRQLAIDSLIAKGYKFKSELNKEK